MPDSQMESVFGPPPANIVLAEDTRSGNDAAVVILWLVAALAVMLRLVSRKISKADVGWDDLVIIIALLFCTSTAGMTIAGGVYGSGTHVWTLTIPKVGMIFKILFAYTFLYAAAVSSTKISILLLYYRIFKRSAGPLFDISIGVGGLLTASYPIIVWATMASSCKPLHFFWDRFSGVEGSCIDTAAFFLALGIINMLTDIVVLLIPIPHIWKLQMDRRRRLAVIGIIGLGAFVCVASVVRIHYLSIFLGATDVTYVMGPIFIWSSVEPCIGILGACLSTYSPLFRLFRRRGFSNNSESRQDLASNSHKTRLETTGMSRRRRSEIDDAFVNMTEDEYQLTTYIAAGKTGSERSYQTGILVQSQINQEHMSR